jgi:hypothetical protein
MFLALRLPLCTDIFVEDELKKKHRKNGLSIFFEEESTAKNEALNTAIGLCLSAAKQALRRYVSVMAW